MAEDVPAQIIRMLIQDKAFCEEFLGDRVRTIERFALSPMQSEAVLALDVTSLLLAANESSDRTDPAPI